MKWIHKSAALLTIMGLSVAQCFGTTLKLPAAHINVLTSQTINNSGAVSTASENITSAGAGTWSPTEGNGPAVAPAASQDVTWADSNTHRPMVNPNNSGNFMYALVVASGTAVLGTSQINSAVCASAVTVANGNVATTDTVNASFNGDPTAVTGYVPLTTGMLAIVAYPTAGNVNFKVCNNTSSAITPGAITLNWNVIR